MNTPISYELFHNITMLRIFVLTLSIFWSITRTSYVGYKPFNMTSAASIRAEQLKKFLTLFGDYENIVKLFEDNSSLKAVGTIIRMDRNKINALKNKEGETLDEDDAEFLHDTLDYVSYLQLHHGPLDQGLFDVDMISSDGLEDWMGLGIGTTIYSAKRARELELQRREDDAMAEEQRLKLEILQAELRTANASSAAGGLSGGATASSGANTGTGQGSGQSGQSGGQSGTYNDSKTSTKVDLSEEMSVLLHGSQYYKWIKVVNMLAKATGTSKTLDPTYTPGSQRETDNWNQQQALMFVALNKNVKLPIGLTILEKHLDKSDAQAVFRELADHFTGAGAIEITETEDKLHDKVFMTDAKWYMKDKPGSTLTDVIERWERNLLEYDSTTGTVTSPAKKKKAFQKFIKHIKPLSHVTDNEKSTTALMGIAAASTLYTPDMVIQLYKNAATRIDLERKESVLKERGTISRAAHLFNQLYDQRSANVTICNDLSNNSLDDDTWYTVFLANTEPTLRLSPEIWGAMTKEERTLWLRGLRREIRDMILSARVNQGATLSGPPSASAPRNRPRDFSSAPKSRTNPTSRYRSGRDPRREGPVNHKARANVTETNRAEYDDDEVVERNVHEMS